MNQMMLEGKFDMASSLDSEETYNPLEFIEDEGDEDWTEDDSAILPSIVPPESSKPNKQVAFYSAERAGSVSQAVRDLVTTNAGRRHILLSIIDWARDGIAASELFSKITEAESDNLSVYEPISYCRMLERAGAVRLKLDEVESKDGSRTQDTTDHRDTCMQEVEYLTIEDELDPIWISSSEGLDVFEELMQGNEWRETVLQRDRVYAEVYLALMTALREEGKTRNELVELAEEFEVTKDPRKYGTYFIDVLEATHVIQWVNAEWNLNDLGRSLLPELEELRKQ